MKETKKNKLERLEEISEKIEDENVSISQGTRLLTQASRIYRDLAKSLFKRTGRTQILKETKDGKYSLHEFDDGR